MKEILFLVNTEYISFRRNSFKVVALFLFLIASLYGLMHGRKLYLQQVNQQTELLNQANEKANKILDKFEKKQLINPDRPWINLEVPFWAIWNTPAPVIKEPSVIMPLSIGQAEHYGSSKMVTNWSTVFDADLAPEIANPERIASGTIDFGFVFIYLFPLILLVLVFDIGTLEKENSLSQLVLVSAGGTLKWMLIRYSFYLVISIVPLVILSFFVLLQLHHSTNFLSPFFNFWFLACIYALIWMGLLFLCGWFSSNSRVSAVRMMVVWTALCLLIPGAQHQIIALNSPVNLMTDLIDTQRDDAQDLWELSPDSTKMRLLNIYPDLEKTQFAQENTDTTEILAHSSSALLNPLIKKEADKIEKAAALKNRQIQKWSWLSIPNFFHNAFNSVAETDYTSYLFYRQSIQRAIDAKINAILSDSWNKKRVDIQQYQNYVSQFNPYFVR